MNLRNTKNWMYKQLFDTWLVIDRQNDCDRLVFISHAGVEVLESSKEHWHSPAGIYLLKVNNRNARTRCEICSTLTIKASGRRPWSNTLKQFVGSWTCKCRLGQLSNGLMNRASAETCWTILKVFINVI